MVHGLAHRREIDPPLAEEEAVLLGVELADSLAPELTDFGGDVVAHLRGVGDVVVHLHVRRADGVDDAQMIASVEP